MKKLSALLVVIAVYAVRGGAQPHGVIRGTVLTEDGRPVARAIVTVSESHYRPRMYLVTTATDESGRFVFPFVPAWIDLEIHAAHEDRRTGASGTLRPVLAGVPTIVVGRLHGLASATGDCGGFSAFRDIPAGTFVWPNEPAMYIRMCL